MVVGHKPTVCYSLNYAVHNELRENNPSSYCLYAAPAFVPIRIIRVCVTGLTSNFPNNPPAYDGD